MNGDTWIPDIAQASKNIRNLIKIVDQLEKRIKHLEYLQGYTITGEGLQ